MQDADDIQAETQALSPMTPTSAADLATINAKHEKLPIEAGADIAGIIPRNHYEAWRLAVAFVKAKIIPNSYEGATPEETTAKVMIGLLKGLEIGLPPVTAISTIMIVNNRPCVWGRRCGRSSSAQRQAGI